MIHRRLAAWLERAADGVVGQMMMVSRERLLRPLERKLASELDKAFAAQEREFVDRLGRLPLSQDLSGWQAAYDASAARTRDLFAAAIHAGWVEALRQSLLIMGAQIGSTPDPGLAPTVAAGRALSVADQIAEATRNAIAGQAATVMSTSAPVTEAVPAGVMPRYDAGLLGRFIASVTEMFRGFRTGLQSRSELIAADQLTTAWETGRSMAVFLRGKPAEKRWITQSSPCSVCAAGAADDWISDRAGFSNGFDLPPAHPRCRCSTDFRDAPAPGAQ